MTCQYFRSCVHNDCLSLVDSSIISMRILSSNQQQYVIVLINHTCINFHLELIIFLNPQGPLRCMHAPVCITGFALDHCWSYHDYSLAVCLLPVVACTNFDCVSVPLGYA